MSEDISNDATAETVSPSFKNFRLRGIGHDRATSSQKFAWQRSSIFHDFDPVEDEDGVHLVGRRFNHAAAEKNPEAGRHTKRTTM